MFVCTNIFFGETDADMVFVEGLETEKEIEKAS